MGIRKRSATALRTTIIPAFVFNFPRSVKIENVKIFNRKGYEQRFKDGPGYLHRSWQRSTNNEGESERCGCRARHGFVAGAGLHNG